MKKNKKNYLLSIIMIFVAVLFLIPFYYILVSTFKTQQQMTQNPLSFPMEPYFGNYERVLETTPILQSFLNTLFVTVGGVTLTVLLGAMAAFPIVFNSNKTNNIIRIFLLGGFMVPAQASIIPLYLLMSRVNMIDSLTGLIILTLPGSIFCSFMIQGYMKSIPIDLFESAYLDGASVWQVFWKIVFPLLQPILITTATFQTMWIWNDFMTPNIFINSESKKTLVLQVYSAISEFTVDWPAFMTLSVMVIIPMVFFFIFAQKYLVKGLTSGAVKG
ncbi:carbohydrate ABC transporter permease [Streptococcus moroccensis]|uniref:Raffinose/stachyose/melibiose transport system permease protein n=1 Tax=Streptococcus moroccensis TaxID=1451356 RepID=A0ABT9YQY9_9STRE|nr:carbohydrate ABC transporter permease [Streptococcus moroccensis]MDQ0222413.1 raffinose/stachyose/melibiose transport system permease protein [Streptococcus moroccensis]